MSKLDKYDIKTTWWDATKVVPTDHSKEETPNWGDFGCILYSCLATFIDYDEEEQRILDKEVVAVYYCENMGGWLYYPSMEPREDNSSLTHWTYFPDPA